MEKFEEYNNIFLNKLSIYLNDYSDYITKDMINSVICGSNISKEEAFKILIATILDIYDNKEIIDYYVKDSFKLLDIDKYQNNLYYKNIKLDSIKGQDWQIMIRSYKPYEAFVYNDLRKIDKRIIPSIGFFDREYKYPCVMQNNREWMLITPNEIETMEMPINEAFGNVLTYGLGLGYYAYMVSLKEDVTSITIVENDKEVIELFVQYILPQFKYKDKVKIICEDAYDYAKRKIKYDYVFVDIWHDPSDGVDAYLKFKSLERKDVSYSYWIEDTIKCYL